MRYLSFTVANYRAISGPLTIDVRKPELTPIVGVNESGKTTVLHALFAFDYANDEQNEGGRHLNESANLYRTTPPAATITAEIELSRNELDVDDKDVVHTARGKREAGGASLRAL